MVKFQTITRNYLVFCGYLLSMLLISNNIYSQSPDYNNLYFENEQTINPAFTGKQIHPSLYISYRNTASSNQNTPESIFFSASSMITNNAALGGRFYKETFKTIGSTTLYLDYSYCLKINDENWLRLGCSTGINFQNKNLTDNSATDSLADENKLNKSNNTDFEIATGFAYIYKNFELSLALPDLMKLKDGTGYSINSMLSYNLMLKENKFEIKPGVLLVYRPETFLFDFNLRAQWNNALWLGITYRSSDAIVLSAGIKYNRLVLSYATQLQSPDNFAKPEQIHQFAVSYTFSKKSKNEKSRRALTRNKKLSVKKNRPEVNPTEVSDVSENEDNVENKDSLVGNNIRRISLVKKDHIESKKKVDKKKYSIMDIGNGIFMVRTKAKNSFDKKIATSGEEVANEDSIILSNLIEYIDSPEKKEDFELKEIGEGVYIIKSNTPGKNISDVQLDSLIINSGIFDQFENIENEDFTETSEEKSYTIELDINDANYHLLTNEDISGKLLAKQNENRKVNYYCGQFNSIGAALKYREYLKKYDDLKTKVLLLNSLE